MGSVLEMIHINAFNTLPLFAIATLVLGELKPVVDSDALRGIFSIGIDDLIFT